MISKLSIGTANFGMKYGIKNNSKIYPKKIKKIIDFARYNKIKYIDTAESYGDAHKVLGKIGVQNFKISTKLPIIHNNILNIDKHLNKFIEKTLFDININSIDTLFIHNVSVLESPLKKNIFSFLKKLKKNKLIKKYGFSIYTKKDFLNIINYDPDVLQVPINIFNRDFEDKSIEKEIDLRSISIEARSIFLQGILLTNNYPKNLLNKNTRIFNRWNKWTINHNISKLDACLNYINSLSFIKKIIVGVDSVSQLQSIICYKKYKNLEFPKNLIIKNRKIIDPRRWNND